MTLEHKKYTSFGEHLRTLREEANLSLRELAQKFDMDASLLAKIERNERPPSRVLITNIAIHFNADQQTLLREYISDVIAYKIVEEDVDP
jgi:transcriptional regulator with XRE-family HTH domain